MDIKYKVSFTQSAESEMLGIYRYILNDSIPNAEQWLEKLMKACEGIKNFPYKYPEFKYTTKPSRQMIFNKNIRIIYTIIDDNIFITHCFRCEQNITEPL